MCVETGECSHVKNEMYCLYTISDEYGKRKKLMDLLKQSDDQIMKIANPIMDSQLEASMNRDFKQVIENFSDAVKSEFTEEMFIKQCDDRESTLGDFTNRKLMGITKQTNLVTIYWNQCLSKTDDEFLAVLALSQNGSGYVIERSYVDLWQLGS